MDLARLNHILVPTTRSDRDRLRRGKLGVIIRPALRLTRALSEEGRVLLLLALMANDTGLNLEATSNYLLWCACVAPLVASMLARPWYRIRHVEIECETPQRVTRGEVAELTLSIENLDERPLHALRIERPFLPWDGKWRSRRPSIDELGPGERRQVTVKVSFRARGRHELDMFHLVQLVPFCLAQGPRRTIESSAFLVVPKPANVASLPLPTTGSYQHGGVALSSKIGESAELIGIRPYRAGDRVRDLHARSWARYGQPMVREYQQEYFSRVGLIVDVGPRRAAARPANSRRARERDSEAALSLAAGLVGYLTRGEALIDVLVADGSVHALTVGRGLGSLGQALDHLAVVEGKQHLDAAAVSAALRPMLSRLSVMLVVCLEWTNAQRELVHAIEARGVDVVAYRVADPTTVTDDDFPGRTICARDIELGTELNL